MSALVYSVKQGSPFAQLVRFEAEGIDLTGAVVRSQIRTSPAGATVFHTFTPTATGAVGSCEAILSLSELESAAIPVGTYVGDVWIEVPGSFGPYGPVDYLLQVLPRVTRPPA
jgi:hypothetical protein